MFQPLEFGLFAFLNRADIGVRIIALVFKATRRIVVSSDLLANFPLQSVFVLPCIVAFPVPFEPKRDRNACGSRSLSKPFQALFLTA